MDLIIEAYMNVLDTIISQYEREALSYDTKKFEEAQDAIIQMKAHKVFAKTLLVAIKETM